MKFLLTVKWGKWLINACNQVRDVSRITEEEEFPEKKVFLLCLKLPLSILVCDREIYTFLYIYHVLTKYHQLSTHSLSAIASVTGFCNSRISILFRLGNDPWSSYKQRVHLVLQQYVWKQCVSYVKATAYWVNLPTGCITSQRRSLTSM